MSDLSGERSPSSAAAAPDRAITQMAVGRRRLVFGALLLVLFIAALAQTIVSTALPTIVGELGGLEYLSWVVTAYLLASTVVTPVYGKLGDMYGTVATCARSRCQSGRRC